MCLSIYCSIHPSHLMYSCSSSTNHLSSPPYIHPSIPSHPVYLYSSSINYQSSPFNHSTHFSILPSLPFIYASVYSISCTHPFIHPSISSHHIHPSHYYIHATHPLTVIPHSSIHPIQQLSNHPFIQQIHPTMDLMDKWMVDGSDR